MLNKNGWGFRAFMIGGAVVLIALLFATFFIIRLYRGLPNLSSFIVDPVGYQTIEDTLDRASLNYIDKYYDQEITTGVIVVSTSNLIKYNILDQRDLVETNSNDKCKGYSLIRRDDQNKLTSESYIECNKYITEGYQSWRVVDE